MGAPARRFGHYLLLEPIGRGGMAEVWRARAVDSRDNSPPLIIKRLHAHLGRDPGFTRLFLREGRVAARLDHPNIVRVLEVGEAEGTLFLAMEYVDGINLATLIADASRLPFGLGAHIVREVCRALHYAHQLVDEHGSHLRLIHRDVKPSNILVGCDGAVRLTDFGIAKCLGQEGNEPTASTTLRGTPGYVAPEQLDGGEVDERSDIYCCGVVLHELLTDEPLFHRATLGETLERMRAPEIDPPSRKVPGVPPALDRICMKALHRDRAQRYQTAKELADDLEAVLKMMPFGSQALASLVAKVVLATPATRTLARSTPARSKRVVLLGLSTVAAMLAGWGWFGRPPSRPRPAALQRLAEDDPLPTPDAGLSVSPRDDAIMVSSPPPPAPPRRRTPQNRRGPSGRTVSGKAEAVPSIERGATVDPFAHE